MKDFFKKTNYFLIPSFITWIFVLYIILTTNKLDLHLSINQYHHHLLDTFFKHYTHMGGFIPFVLIFLALFYNLRTSLFLLISQLIAAIFIYPLKRFFNVARP